MRKTFGIVMLVLGIVLVASSLYIKKEISEGQEKISSAQRRVNQSKSLFNLTPITKEVGKGITNSAQKKIDAGVEEVQYYTDLARWFQIGGIVLVVLGGGVALVAKKK
jgi:hypothetical protein